ncbi:MAG: vitamin B12-dependent ribonucleotide reductase [Nitrospiraceae bacterium]|nr:vitamin B12-dependent ribonucleotide reductase [Nitrospiraceae bacterium]
MRSASSEGFVPPVLTPNAQKVLEKRYLKRNEEGTVIETPTDLFRRVAKTIASIDKAYGKTEEQISGLEREFYNMLTRLEFLPNSPTLMNAGRRLGQLSACFVLPVGDSMESIFDAVKYAAIIHKSGGGTGFSFSKLRPKGDVVGSTKGVSSGPVSFMTVFDTATEAVKQGGTRRGANMGMLSVHHPDILHFIQCKDDNHKLNNFNISVALTDTFMKAVEEDGEFELLNPRNNKPTQKLRAREVFDLIVSHAWGNGEPGVVFIDRINECNPTPHIGAIESTNPCGEQPLLPYESCNLGSINLARMIKDNAVDWDKLSRVTRHAVHFLDNVIDANKYPLPDISHMTKANRKIGLGVMGFADMLIQLGIPYNSGEALELAEKVMGTIKAEAVAQSELMAAERGTYPNYDPAVCGKKALRNATTTTIAPTGTLSIIAGCSSGVEPLFAVCYVRTVMEGTKLIEVNPYFEQVARKHGFWSRELLEKVAESGSLHGIPEIPDSVKAVFATAHDITPEDHIRMQAAFQKHTCNAVSKTVNFPNNATKEDVEQVYRLAYKLGCKGVTVYRDGSREQVLTTGSKTQAAQAPAEQTQATGKIIPKKRPDVLRGTTRKMHTGCGHVYVTINEDGDGHFFELFTSMGKAGGCASSQSEALGRLISLALRSNIEPEEIVKQLKGISCHQPQWGAGGRILSCSDALAKSLEMYHYKKGNGNGHGKHGETDSASGGTGSDYYEEPMIIGACPECGGAVEHEGGCAICRNCGFTKCA